MKADSDFEVQYAQALKECLVLIEEESRHEKEQISLALRIGEKVNKIVEHMEDKESIFKRMARDIFSTRGKLVTPTKISGYRQLYLNFQSMDTISTMGKSMITDLSVDMLTEIALKDELSESRPQENGSPLLTMLKKANRLLYRFEVVIEDKQPDDKDLVKILEELKLICEKSGAILNTVQHTGGRSQLDFFKKSIFQTTEV